MYPKTVSKLLLWFFINLIVESELRSMILWPQLDDKNFGSISFQRNVNTCYMARQTVFSYDSHPLISRNTIVNPTLNDLRESFTHFLRCYVKTCSI